MMESSVSGYEITKIRKVLETIRKGWSFRNENGFSFYQPVSDKDTVWSFSVRYVVSQYQKRKARRNRKTKSN